jgi:hypothetical protein
LALELAVVGSSLFLVVESSALVLDESFSVETVVFSFLTSVDLVLQERRHALMHTERTSDTSLFFLINITLSNYCYALLGELTLHSFKSIAYLPLEIKSVISYNY